MDFSQYADSELIDEEFGYDPDDNRYENAFKSPEKKARYWFNEKARRNYLKDVAIWNALRQRQHGTILEISSACKQMARQQLGFSAFWPDSVAGSLRALKKRGKVRVIKEAQVRPWENRIYAAEAYVDCPGCMEEVESHEMIDYLCENCYYGD